MPDSLDDLLKKDFKLELSKFRTKTAPTLAEAIALRMQKAEALKAKPADDKRLKLLDLDLQKLTGTVLKEADSTQARLTQCLKNYKPEPKDPRGLVKWYADIVDKESGVAVGKDLKLWGHIDFGKKEVTLQLKGKF